MARKRTTLGVDWHLPAKRGPGYAKRPFATTTKASSDLIEMLAEDGLTWDQIAADILFDPEAKAVAQGFIDAGHGQTKALTHTTPQETPSRPVRSRCCSPAAPPPRSSRR